MFRNRLNFLRKMVVIAIYLTGVLVFSGCEKIDEQTKSDGDEQTKPDGLNKEEAQSAFRYLNEVRTNPTAYGKEIGCDLTYVESRHQLIWNEQLAEAAEQKALDMAERNYFGHVDPDGYGMNYYINMAGYTLIEAFLKDKAQNNFESIGAGYKTGKEAIQKLILDKGYPPGEEGHRIHLLGIDPFWANCYDIGIGFARSSKSNYSTYCCVLVAKKQF